MTIRVTTTPDGMVQLHVGTRCLTLTQEELLRLMPVALAHLIDEGFDVHCVLAHISLKPLVLLVGTTNRSALVGLPVADHTLLNVVGKVTAPEPAV